LPEPLLHFAVPFVSLEAAGVDWRRALFASVVALTPDLDLSSHVHRSQTHSVVVLVVIVLPMLAPVHKKSPEGPIVALSYWANDSSVAGIVWQFHASILVVA